MSAVANYGAGVGYTFYATDTPRMKANRDGAQLYIRMRDAVGATQQFALAESDATKVPVTNFRKRMVILGGCPALELSYDYTLQCEGCRAFRALEYHIAHPRAAIAISFGAPTASADLNGYGLLWTQIPITLQLD
jgi:hypothetical protein